jgi:hypothetical protein
MPVSQQYQLQIGKLKELIAYLNSFETEVQKAVAGYRNKISALLEQGLPAEVGQKVLNEFYQQSKNQADKNSAIVKDQTIPYIAHNVKSLEQLI